MNQFLLGLVNVNDVVALHGFNTYKNVILKALEVCDTDITDIEARKEQVSAPVAVSARKIFLSSWSMCSSSRPSIITIRT